MNDLDRQRQIRAGRVAVAAWGSAVAIVVAACGSPSPSMPRDAAAVDARRDATPEPDAAPDAAPDASGARPDLVLMGSRIANSIQIVPQEFSPDSCAIAEGCVDGPGLRKLLRFDTVTYNQGVADLYLGAPNFEDPIWEYSSCHDHFHFTHYATYQLIDLSGEVAAGHKQAFCLMDTDQIDPNAPGSSYTCGDQGISAGWADTYHRQLTCQWIDITDTPAGDYTLRIVINHMQLLPESNYDNNSLGIPVTIP